MIDRRRFHRNLHRGWRSRRRFGHGRMRPGQHRARTRSRSGERGAADSGPAGHPTRSLRTRTRRRSPACRPPWNPGNGTARSITELYLERIAALDGRGPELRSVIETNPDALDIADQLDQERAGARVARTPARHPGRAEGQPRHARPDDDHGGVARAGGVDPAAGLVRRAAAARSGRDHPGQAEHERVGVLPRGAGDEWLERAGGQCRNPYALDRNPCGSSSGSGVAAAANLSALTVGTETGGSIMCPSSTNGIVGIKPTVGLWSRSGIIPISHSQDTAGPMCRTVRDAAALLGPVTGVDPRDPATAASEGNAHTDYTQFLDPAGLQGARLGVAGAFRAFRPTLWRSSTKR